MKTSLKVETTSHLKLKDHLKAYPVALLPLGATEQHGGHLPLGTDTFMAESFVEKMAHKSCGLVLPALPFGYSWSWRDIEGTITLGLDTFMHTLTDISNSLDRWGVRALCVVTGHESNRQPIKYALREKITDRLPIKLLFLFYPGLEQIKAETESPLWLGDNFHADEIETSLMLAEHPELVDMSKAISDYPEVPSNFGYTETSMGDIMNSGVFGNPTVSSQEKGKRWMDLMTGKAAHLWMDYLEEQKILTAQTIKELRNKK